MMTYLGKTQFNADRPPVPAFGLDRALGAEIADGDFRTFVLLCQLAAHEQPDSDAPYTERGYVDLARLHPGRQRPTAETVRGRLYRLARAGLIRRQRAGRTTWRTYPQLDGARLWTAIAASPSNPISQGASLVRNQAGDESTHPSAPPERALETRPTTGTIPLETDSVATPLSASPRPTQASTEPVGAREESTQPETGGWSPSVDRRVEPPHFGSLALSGAPKAIAPRIVRPSATDTPPLGGYTCRSQGLTLQPNPVRTLSDLLPSWKPVRTARVGEEPAHTQDAEPAVDVQTEHTQPEPVAAVDVQVEHTQAEPVAPVGAQPEYTETLPVSSAHTQPEPMAVEGPSAAVGAQSEHAQVEPAGVESIPSEVMGVEPKHTQTSADPVSVQPEHTQTGYDHQTLSPVAHTQAQPEVVGVSPAHTQASAGTVEPAKTASPKAKPGRSGRQPSRAYTRARASVLSGTDSLSSEKLSSPKKEKTETDSTGRADAKATPSHPVLDRVDVPAGYEGLAIQLATLQPQGMNYEGIAECLRQPELTRAWTEWTLAKGESIHNPPAFIRQRVRAGQPPAAEKPIPPHQRLVRNPNSMGWDEPARPEARYVTYQSLYNIPRTQEVKHDKNQARPTGDAHPRETLH